MIINGGRLQGSTFQDQPQYVTAGLIEYLDAVDYLGSGTAWNAAVGSNGNLTNSPAYTASAPTYFNFTPSSLQWAQLPPLGDFGTWTVEAWFRPAIDLSTTNLTSVVTTVYDEPGGPHPGAINYTLTNYDGTGSSLNGISVGFYNGGWHLTNLLTTTPGTWYQVVGTYDGTDLKQYNNGTFSNSVTPGVASTANGGATWIAKRWDGPLEAQYFFPGDIAIVRIYNTALTSDQVALNWNGSKGRFGL